MNPFDIIPEEDKKKKPTPPPLDTPYLRTEIHAIWKGVEGGEVELDPVSMEERADKFDAYKNQCEAHLTLYKYMMEEGSYRQKKKATTHLNSVRLLKVKADFSFTMMTIFKMPLPPYDYHLCRIANQRLYWKSIGEILTHLGEGGGAKKKTSPPTPDWELSTSRTDKTQTT